jgi:hypothetical protein
MAAANFSRTRQRERSISDGLSGRTSTNFVTVITLLPISREQALGGRVCRDMMQIEQAIEEIV